MENKYRKILQRAFKVISPDFDPTHWSDQEFQTVFVSDVNFLLDHMVRRSKQMEDMKVKKDVSSAMNATADHLIEAVTNG